MDGALKSAIVVVAHAALDSIGRVGFPWVFAPLGNPLRNAGEDPDGQVGEGQAQEEAEGASNGSDDRVEVEQDVLVQLFDPNVLRPKNSENHLTVN